MDTCWLFLVVSATTLCFSWSHVAGSKVIRIRGIPPSKISLYSPDRDFQCFDGSLIVPYRYVNDDYCDCPDGSDEPGTSACTNGSFFCQNSGHQSSFIPSTWVNDGVCDCCDASDEYESDMKCKDNCHELGREARLEAQKAAELAREGNKKRIEMLAEGKQIKSELQSKLSKLRVDHEEAELTKKEKEILKKQAEERESVAMEKYKPAEPERLESDNEEEHEKQWKEAEDYFKFLDSDSSGTVSVAELQTRVTFDKDKNGEVSEEEALFFLNNEQELNMQEFIDFAWKNIKPFLMLEKGLFKPATDEPREDDIEVADQVPPPENVEDEGEESDDHEETEEGEEREPEPEEPAEQYDEETQGLIEEANNARNRFQEADKAVQDLLTDIKKVEEKLSIDYGTDGEFAALDDQCFDYTDLEYVYTLCIFGKAIQKAKSGGSEVSLGHWQEWVGPEDNRYSKMKYDRGFTCWNGPARSTVVTLTCGIEHKLISVTEPSRCEYAMEFSTPAVCKILPEVSDSHDEL